jgi:hypothetical protein
MAPSAGARISKRMRATSPSPGSTVPSQYPGPGGCCEHPPGRLPPAYLLTHAVSGGTCQLILRLPSLSFQTSRLCLHLPAPFVLAALPVAVAVSRGGQCCRVSRGGQCCGVRGLPGVSTCGSSAAAKPSNARATSRDAEGAGLWLLCVSGSLARPRLDEVAIIQPCAPYDPRRRTRSFPVGRSPSPVVGDHAVK